MNEPNHMKRIRHHYLGRAFSRELVSLLCDEIDRRTESRGVEIAQGRWIPLEAMEEVFLPVDSESRPTVLQPKPAAIIAMSFGYRLDSPFARFPEDRRPGPNNEILAEITERCHRIFPEAHLAVQHEVATALAESGGPKPEVTSPARDWNTNQVLAYFLDHLPRNLFTSNRNVIVVSHLHHYGRCALRLRHAGLEAAVPPTEIAPYAKYDPSEAQPRFRSPWEYLLNDFLGLCGTLACGQGPQ
jgi:hypothetical protein